jgi:hypothetical protein
MRLVFLLPVRTARLLDRHSGGLSEAVILQNPDPLRTTHTGRLSMSVGNHIGKFGATLAPPAPRLPWCSRIEDRGSRIEDRE